MLLVSYLKTIMLLYAGLASNGELLSGHIQSDSTETPQSTLQVGTSYMNIVNYRGRTFGINQYGFMPMAKYISKTGFVLNATGYYWSGMDNKLAKLDLGIGYEKEIVKNLYASFNYERWLWNENNVEEQNPLKNYLAADMTYDFGYWNVSGTYEYMWGDQHLSQLTFQIAGDIPLYSNEAETSELKFQPGFTYIMANQSSLSVISAPNYLSNKKGKKTATTLINDPFQVQDYELSAPLYLKWNNTEITGAYRYAFPLNGSPDEHLKPFGYFTLDFVYNIKW